MSAFPWEDSDEYRMARANYMACAYNAAVNSGTSRGIRKMGDLVHAINSYERVAGRAKLQFLVDQGVIESFTACPVECHMRPGGLFHAKGCENDFNSELSRARRKAATDNLPARLTYAATPSLVG